MVQLMLTIVSLRLQTLRRTGLKQYGHMAIIFAVHGILNRQHLSASVPSMEIKTPSAKECVIHYQHPAASNHHARERKDGH
jgi:hypothetical protein